MNTKTKEGARNKGNPYFLRVPWNKGGLLNTDLGILTNILRMLYFEYYTNIFKCNYLSSIPASIYCILQDLPLYNIYHP